MTITDFIGRFAERSAMRPLPAAPRAVVLPEEDAPQEPLRDHLGDAEGQSFMIEYTDSGGRKSRRRITVYGVSAGRAGVPMLNARCHERNATRAFRVDRIACCIDYSGEVHDDVATFLFDNFGMAYADGRRTTARDPVARWRDVLDLISDDAVILSAMSRSDGSVHSLEVEAATQHLCKLIEATGRFLGPAETEKIAAHLMRLRPSAETISRALTGLGRQEAGRVQKLLRAAVAVLDADGLRHPAELELLDDLCRDLTGVGIG